MLFSDPIDLIVVGLNPLKLSQKMIKTLQQEEALSAEIEGGKEFTVDVADGDSREELFFLSRSSGLFRVALFLLDCEEYNAADYLAKIGDPIDLIVVGLNPLKLSRRALPVK